MTLSIADDKRAIDPNQQTCLRGSTVNKPREPRAGEKLSAQEAKAYVEYLYSTLAKASHEKIHNGPFMRQLRDGTLPLPVIRQYFKNWAF